MKGSTTVNIHLEDIGPKKAVELRATLFPFQNWRTTATVSISSSPFEPPRGQILRLTLCAPLGARLQEIREKIVASGLPLLEAEEVEREVRERRGGYESLDHDTNFH